jgi:hypothetical protein
LIDAGVPALDCGQVPQRHAFVGRDGELARILGLVTAAAGGAPGVALV